MKKKDHINGLVVIPLLMVALAFQVSAEPESSGSIENKEVLTFKLMRGTQYPMCHEYVAMLNKTGYTEPPICDRIILPEFKKFKAVPWVKIENKDEIKSVTKNMIKMESLSPLNRKYTFDMQWAMAKKNMDLGVYPIISRAKIDVDYDGQDENAYKFSSIHPNLSKYNACITLEKYFFDYGEKTKSIYGDSSNCSGIVNLAT